MATAAGRGASSSSCVSLPSVGRSCFCLSARTARSMKRQTGWPVLFWGGRLLGCLREVMAGGLRRAGRSSTSTEMRCGATEPGAQPQSKTEPNFNSRRLVKVSERCS